jgi:hypothetical protein
MRSLSDILHSAGEVYGPLARTADGEVLLVRGEDAERSLQLDREGARYRMLTFEDVGHYIQTRIGDRKIETGPEFRYSEVTDTGGVYEAAAMFSKSRVNAPFGRFVEDYEPVLYEDGTLRFFLADGECPETVAARDEGRLWSIVEGRDGIHRVLPGKRKGACFSAITGIPWPWHLDYAVEL